MYDAVQETGALNGKGTVTQAGLRKSLSLGNSAREEEVNSVKQQQHASSKVSMAVSENVTPDFFTFYAGYQLIFFLHCVLTLCFSCIVHPIF